MSSKEKLSRELLREIRKNPEFREVNDQLRFAQETGAEIARIRKRKRLTEEELGEKIGKDKKVIRRMEKGEYKQYTVKLLLQIAQATNTSLHVEFAD